MPSLETSPAPSAPAETAAATGSGDAAPAPPAQPAVSAPVPQAAATPYALSQRTLFSAHEFRRLTADFEEIRAGSARRLAILFRTEFALKLAALQTPTFRQFSTALSRPTHLTLFKIEPLRGIGALEIGPALGLALTDRLMGGPGGAVASPRDLSEIEIALLDQVASLLCEAWCVHWAGWKELKAVLLGHENDPRYLQTSSPDSAMLVASFEAAIGEAKGPIQFALPLATLDPLIQQMREDLKPPVEAPARPVPAKAAHWNSALDDVPVAIRAELSGPLVTARQIPQLKIGDVLKLPDESSGQVLLRLGNTVRFAGRLGTHDDHWAVEVTNVMRP
jgi:flagellar motor switch protein FliM